MLYRTAIKELLFLLSSCDDKALVESFLGFYFVLPIARNIPDPYQEHNLKIITIQELFSLSTEQDFNLILQGLDLLVERNEDNAWAYILRARALWAVQYYAAAKQDLEKSLTLKYTFTAHRMLAETCFFLKKYPQALNIVQRLVSEYADNGRLYVIRYLIYCALADITAGDQKEKYIQEAIANLEKASALTPRMYSQLQLLITHLKKRIGNS